MLLCVGPFLTGVLWFLYLGPKRSRYLAFDGLVKCRLFFFTVFCVTFKCFVSRRLHVSVLKVRCYLRVYFNYNFTNILYRRLFLSILGLSLLFLGELNMGWSDIRQSFSHSAAAVRSSCNRSSSFLFLIVLYIMLPYTES